MSKTTIERHLMLRTFFVTVTLTALLNSTPRAAADFFDGPAAGPGEPMFFSIYSIRTMQEESANMWKIANGRFTSAGPYYSTYFGSDPLARPDSFYAQVNEANALGLGFIAHIPWHPDVVNDTAGSVRGDSMAAIAEHDVRAHVRSVMNATLTDSTANDTVSAWYILPEALRPWVPAEMDYLEIVASEVALRDNIKQRPISMYNPNHRDVEELKTTTGLGLDWTMMGVYATNVSFDTRGARIADGVQRIVTAASETQTMPIPVFQLSEDYDNINDPTDRDIETLAHALGDVSDAEAIKHVIRHDVYQGIVRGAQGIQIWSGCDCRAGLTTFQEQLDGYVSVAQDMNGVDGLADVFLHGEARDDLTVNQTDGPSEVTHDGVTIDTVAMANMAYGGGRTLVLVNSSNSEISLDVSGLPTGEPIVLVDLFDDATRLVTDSFTVDMKPLGVSRFQIFPQAIPEPSSLALAAIGLSSLLGFSLLRRRRTPSPSQQCDLRKPGARS